MFKHTFTYLMNPSIITKNDYEVVKLSSGNFLVFDDKEDKVYVMGKNEDVHMKLMLLGVYIAHWAELEQAIKVLKEQ